MTDTRTPLLNQKIEKSKDLPGRLSRCACGPIKRVTRETEPEGGGGG